MSTWVLLRGLGREARHWGDFPRVLEQQLPLEDGVMTLDLPGNGRRWRERSPLDVAAMVDAARAELAERSVHPPYVLVALSLGGMVAAEWAARVPAEVDACVLINSSVGSFSRFWERLQPRSYAALLACVLPGAHATRERAVLAMTSAREPDPQLVSQWVSHARSKPVSSLNLVRQLVAAWRFRAPAAMPVPTLVLASRGDRLVSPDCSRAIAREWKLPLREHPDAGHDLPLDDPGWVARQIAGWYGLRTH